MTDLSSKTCSACRADSPQATQEQIQQALADLPEWNLVLVDGVRQLQRVYKLKNFTDALKLTLAIGELAEENNHHPSLLTEWGKVTVNWWTHKIKGLHENDLIMAAKTDQTFQNLI